MKHSGAAPSGGERGQSLVEMALITLVLLFLVAGIADLGRAFYTYTVITNAAREGARYASLFPHYAEGPDEFDGIIGAVRREADQGHVELDECTITISPDPRDGAVAPAGTPIGVEVSCPYGTILGNLLGLAAPFELNLRNGATMVVFGLD
jgi:hypothetical protein